MPTPDSLSVSDPVSEVVTERFDPRPIASHARGGPKMLFFSGGSALDGLSRRLKQYTRDSIHLMTPFDSGGSSAVLRRVFEMPSLGDIRQRLLALSDGSDEPIKLLQSLLGHRLAVELPNSELRQQLQAMAAGTDDRMAALPASPRSVVARHLTTVLELLPEDTDLKGASIGNLVLAGSYIGSDNDLDATLSDISRLLNVRGTVRAIVNDNLQLGVKLKNGQTVVGQHLITGKEHPTIDVPIDSVFLTDSLVGADALEAKLDSGKRDLIAAADLICFGPGSFFSSLVANVLPEGVGRAVAANPCPKVWIPNLGFDPEQLAMGFGETLQQLLNPLRRDHAAAAAKVMVSHVIVDSDWARSCTGEISGVLDGLDIQHLELPLVTDNSAPYYDDARLLDALLSLL